jgi:hypothetical protein
MRAGSDKSGDQIADYVWTDVDGQRREKKGNCKTCVQSEVSRGVDGKGREITDRAGQAPQQRRLRAELLRRDQG